MMPELDGVETTHIIRRFHPEYNDIPIIALTANAVSGTKEMFLNEGMNDFVAKPIEMRAILSKLRTWLPKYKIKKVYHAANEEQEQIDVQESARIEIAGLDTESALKLLGSEELFRVVLKDYYQVIEKKANLIKQLEENEDWHGYTIEVHALKSASKQIGAMELSSLAAQMEAAGNAGNGKLIHESTDAMLTMYLEYAEILKPYFAEEVKNDAELQECTVDDIRQFFVELRETLEELDMDAASEILDRMDGFRYEDGQTLLLEQMREAVSEYDSDRCEELIGQWESVL